VSRLIHVNGPPGIGKSTIAQRYVDAHPGTLNLDIDQVRRLIGGWREDFLQAGELVRPIALGMAGTHLEAGHDVVMPQFLGRLVEIERFEAVALHSRSLFCEVVLMDAKERAIDRFVDRGDEAQDPWHQEVADIVEQLGGRAHLAEMCDQLVEVTRARPSATVIHCAPGALDATYEALLAALDAGPLHP
jgi:predicted kinase